MTDLLKRWMELIDEFSSTERTARLGQEILARWSGPDRHYHAPSHLRAVLDALDILAAEMRSPVTVRLAAWFHDAVYDGRPGDDERASAELAGATMSELGFSQDRIDEVQRLVLLTIDHAAAPDDADGATLCDADLSVLGGTPEQYRAYTAAVRRDYAQVPDDAFRAGRAAVLERLLARDPLFQTRTGQQLWEEAARHNIAAELTHLRGGSGTPCRAR